MEKCFVSKSIHNWDIKKYCLNCKGLEKIILDFFPVYIIIIVLDFLMLIDKMVLC